MSHEIGRPKFNGILRPLPTCYYKLKKNACNDFSKIKAFEEKISGFMREFYLEYQSKEVQL